MEQNFINVLVVSAGFMLLFTSFQTGGIIQGTVVQSIHKQDPSYNADGFISMCIVYATVSLFNWFAPAFVNYCGLRLSMVLSSLTYIVFIANFILPIDWVLYVVSTIVGVGAAVLWTAQGAYLTQCSTKETMARNSGLFWAILQSSLLWGNIFVFVYFTGDSVEKTTRIVTYSVLTVVGGLGVGALCLMRKPDNKEDRTRDSNVDMMNEGALIYIKNSIKESWKVLITKQMLLLVLTFCYAGIELGFTFTIYGTAIGNNGNFDEHGDQKKYVGLSGVLIGVGEIVGGLAFGILGHKTTKMGRDPIIALGFVVHMISFYLIFINFPPNSPFEVTNDAAYIEANLPLALFCSFMLGLGDACYNTQIYSIIGTLYSEDSAPAFSLFKFFQAVACAVALFYSAVVNLYWQLAILVVVAILSTASFCHIEFQLKKKELRNKR